VYVVKEKTRLRDEWSTRVSFDTSLYPAKSANQAIFALEVQTLLSPSGRLFVAHFLCNICFDHHIFDL
jgi:hypothetical protein